MASVIADQIRKRLGLTAADISDEDVLSFRDEAAAFLSEEIGKRLDPLDCTEAEANAIRNLAAIYVFCKVTGLLRAFIFAFFLSLSIFWMRTWCKICPLGTVHIRADKGEIRGEGTRYVHMEVGHVGENIYLQAESLGLGTVVIGAFYDEWVQRLLELPENQKPLYIIPVGRPPHS